MDYFNNILTTFLGLEHVSCVAVFAGSESSQISSKNILIYVSKMSEGFTDLDRHEGEQLMTEFSFLGELSLYVQLWIILLNIYFGVNLISCGLPIYVTLS